MEQITKEMVVGLGFRAVDQAYWLEEALLSAIGFTGIPMLTKEADDNWQLDYVADWGGCGLPLNGATHLRRILDAWAYPRTWEEVLVAAQRA